MQRCPHLFETPDFLLQLCDAVEVTADEPHILLRRGIAVGSILRQRILLACPARTQARLLQLVRVPVCIHLRRQQPLLRVLQLLPRGFLRAALACSGSGQEHPLAASPAARAGLLMIMTTGI